MPTTTSVFNVDGMSCNHCVNSIKNAVGSLKGVEKVEVHLDEKTVAVEYNGETVTPQTIKETIEDQGYDVK